MNFVEFVLLKFWSDLKDFNNVSLKGFMQRATGQVKIGANIECSCLLVSIDQLRCLFSNVRLSSPFDSTH